MLRLIAAFTLVPFMAFGASQAELDRLHRSLSTEALMGILSEEGIEQSEALRQSMFPGRGGVGWTATAERIYATERLNNLFRTAFDTALENSDATPLLEFYEGETGSRVAELEVKARRAIMSDEVEDAARAAYEDIAGYGSAREELLEEFADLNDLIDRNVAGALNANLAFMRGLGSGEGFDLSEEDILRDVWGQEASIREDTIGWVFGFMTFAYEPLSDAQLQAYVDMTATEAGRDLNRALFAGFDAIFLDVSYAIGAATGQFSLGDEL